MYQTPYNMTSNWTYECPLTGKTFEFNRETKRDAFAAQQAHTSAAIQRLERLAGRQLSFRELIRASRTECEQAKATEATEQPAKQPQDKSVGDLIGAALLKTAFPHAC